MPGYSIEDRAGSPFLTPAPGFERPIDLPGEVLPRVVAVDLGDTEAILTFVQSFGPLGAAASAYAALGVEGAAALADLPRRVERWRSIGGWDRFGEWTEDFELGAAHLAALLACTIELERSRFGAARLARAWPPSAPWRAPGTRGQTAAFLVASINAGLFDVRAMLATVEGQDTGHPLGLVRRARLPIVRTFREPATLLGVGMVELANHVTSNREYRQCKFEGCARLFSVQEGARSKYGQHRPDALYCRPEHARAQAQRDYRRRKAAGKGGRP